ncbi:NAD(P)H-dependent oxidoreductase [Olivibacter sp. CPCC 100613]|uniref:NAD(P)H-dependent oxidoreductase n=1 Tax=Olivibacter sp. CPCC 100613 TaxID=3079931 RepID=UPI002FF80178
MEKKNILLINGHPDKESFNQLITERYIETATSFDVNVRSLMLRELDFDPNLKYGYRKRMELEPDLLKALDHILWSDHLVWVHPLWWWSYPALMKGFIDRLFLPGIGFASVGDGSYKKLFSGKTARIISTGDTPEKDYEEQFKRSAFLQLKEGTLEFCGIAPVYTTYISPIYRVPKEQLDVYLQRVSAVAAEDIRMLSVK